MNLEVTNSTAFTAGKGRESLPDLSLAGYLLLPVVIFVTALLAVGFSRQSNYIMTLWPVDAMILVALLRRARTLANYSFIFAAGTAAIALASIASGNALTASVIVAVADAFEVAIGLALLSIFDIDASNLTSFRNFLIFILVACGIAPLGSNTVGAMVLGPAHALPWQTVWMHAYPAHALGMIIVAPFLISVTSSEWRSRHVERRRGEALAMLALVIGVAICAGYFRSLVFFTVPAILFATLRFGVVGATTATLVTMVIISGFVVRGIGEPLLSAPLLSERILGLQILMAVSALWSLPIAVLLAERERLLDSLSVANSQLQLESERKSHLVIGLHRHLSTAEEKERLRLSHELHDQAGQSLVASMLELSEVDPLIEAPARDRLHLVRQRMEEMGKTLHRIAWELRPPSIEELGLCKALASYLDDWGEQCGTDVDFHCDDPLVDEVPNEIGSAVYRVVQEALTNIVKHAQKPSSVSVVARRVNGTLQVIIEDNGCGFDVAGVAASAGRHRGLGLDGMRERLLLIGGTLEVESTIGVGTTIFARIPLGNQRPAV